MPFSFCPKSPTPYFSGFTLIEVAMIMTVIGGLAAVAIPKYMQARQEAEKNNCLNHRQAAASEIRFQWANTFLHSDTIIKDKKVLQDRIDILLSKYHCPTDPEKKYTRGKKENPKPEKEDLNQEEDGLTLEDTELLISCPTHGTIKVSLGGKIKNLLDLPEPPDNTEIDTVPDADDNTDKSDGTNTEDSGTGSGSSTESGSNPNDGETTNPIPPIEDVDPPKEPDPPTDVRPPQNDHGSSSVTPTKEAILALKNPVSTLNKETNPEIQQQLKNGANSAFATRDNPYGYLDSQASHDEKSGAFAFVKHAPDGIFEGIGTWQIGRKEEQSDIFFYWTPFDIQNMTVGEKFPIMRLNAMSGNYTVWEAEVEWNLSGYKVLKACDGGKQPNCSKQINLSNKSEYNPFKGDKKETYEAVWEVFANAITSGNYPGVPKMPW